MATFSRVRAVAGEPLPSNMNDGLTAVGWLNPQLQGFKNLTGPLGDQIHGNLTSETADSLTNSDRPQRRVGLAKCHDGSPADVWSDQLRNFSPEQEADHLREKPEKQVGRSRAQRVTDVRRDGAQTGPHQKSKGTTGGPYEPGPHQPRGPLPARSAEECPPPNGLRQGGGVKETERSNDVIRGTDIVSPTAIGLKDALGLRRTMMEAPQTYGRISSGTSPLSRRLTTSERSRRSRSEEAGRSASRTCEGRSPDRPAPEVEGNDRSALRTWSTSAERAAPGAIRRRVSTSKRSSTGGRGEGDGEKQRRHPWDGQGGSCKSGAQARRREPSWMRVVTLATTDAGRTSESSTWAGGLRSLLNRTGKGAQRLAQMPLSQSRQRRRVSPSCRRTCFRPPREGAGRISAGRVRRSVHDLTSR